MSDPAVIAAAAAFITLIGAFGCGIAGLAWWLSGQFRTLQIALEAKLETHASQDTARFETVNNRLWQIELRNARRDGRLHDNALEMP